MKVSFESSTLSQIHDFFLKKATCANAARARKIVKSSIEFKAAAGLTMCHKMPSVAWILISPLWPFLFVVQQQQQRFLQMHFLLCYFWLWAPSSFRAAASWCNRHFFIKEYDIRKRTPFISLILCAFGLQSFLQNLLCPSKHKQFTPVPGTLASARWHGGRAGMMGIESRTEQTN